MSRVTFLISLFLTLANFACRDNPAGPDSGDLHLSAEDVGVTDLWLRVKVTQSYKHASAQDELYDGLTMDV